MFDEEFLRRKISLLTPKQTAVAASAALDRLQQFPNEAQVIGSAALFILVCARFGLKDYGNLLSLAHNYVFDASGLRIPFRGIERYLKEILKE